MKENFGKITYILCAQILLRKLNKKVHLTKEDLKIMKIILEDYVKESDKNV